MKTNNILKVMLAASNIIQKTASNIVNKGHEVIEDKILQGNYVTREEFEKLKILVVKLQEELAQVKKNDKKLVSK